MNTHSPPKSLFSVMLQKPRLMVPLKMSFRESRNPEKIEIAVTPAFAGVTDWELLEVPLIF
jgi:hypothetical protein